MRAAHRAETDEHVQVAIARHTAQFWNDELARIGVPCAPINTLQQVLDHPDFANGADTTRWVEETFMPATQQAGGAS